MYVNVVMLCILTESTVTPNTNTQHQTCYSLLAIPTQLTKMLLNLASSIYFPNKKKATKKIKMTKKHLQKGRMSSSLSKKCINNKTCYVPFAPTKPLLLPINWLLLSIQLWQAWAPGCHPASRHRFERFFWLEKIPGCLTKSATPPKFNIAPEKWWLEDYFAFGMAYFQGLC